MQLTQLYRPALLTMLAATAVFGAPAKEIVQIQRDIAAARSYFETGRLGRPPNQ